MRKELDERWTANAVNQDGRGIKRWIAEKIKVAGNDRRDRRESMQRQRRIRRTACSIRTDRIFVRLRALMFVMIGMFRCRVFSVMRMRGVVGGGGSDLLRNDGPCTGAEHHL